MNEKIKKDLEKLYTKNDLGYVYQNTECDLEKETIEYFKKEHGIKTDVHRMCINCQVRQIEKYKNAPDGAKVFKPKCKFVPKGLPKGSSNIIKKIAADSGIPKERATLLVKSSIDPVSWSELMLGFNDGNDNWRIRDYQKEQIRCTADRYVIREGRRSGKALPLSTPIPTPNGWTTMGDLNEGDVVFDQNGLPTTVTLATEVMEDHDCYKIYFDDNTSIVADSEHRWEVSTRSTRRRYKQGRLESSKVVMCTDEFKKLVIGKKKQEYNYRIDLAKPVQYPKAELPIEPYLLGYWLGDGVRNTSRITIGMEDVDEVSSYIKELGYEMRIGGDSPIDHCIYGLITKLKELGVEDSKEIPSIYLQASVEQRLELLKGLMDSDGTADKLGHCEFSSSNSMLADGFFELINSLGIKNTRTKNKSTLNGERYKDRNRFYMNTDIPIFKLERKLKRQMIEGRKPKNYRSITKIEKVDSVPVRCITVDSERHLFLAGKQFIPTHNTFSIALKLTAMSFNHTVDKGFDSNGKPIIEGPAIMIVTPYQAQLTNIFNEIESLIKRNPELKRQVLSGTNDSLYVKNPMYRMELKNGATILGFVSGLGVKQDGSGGGTMRGQSADIIYLDEMDMIPEDILDKVVTPILLTKPGVMLIATSTPIGKRGKFYNWCLERPDFKEDYFPSSVLPHWNSIKEELIKENTDEGFRAEYMAEFIEGSYGVFKPSWINNAKGDYFYKDTKNFNVMQKLGIENPQDLIICIGIDWNKNAGTEYYVVGYNTGNGTWIGLDALNISSTEYSSKRWADELLKLNYKWKPDYIYADEGYGHTIIEDLKMHSRRMSMKDNKNDFDQQTAYLADRLVSFNFSKKIEITDPMTGEKSNKRGKHFLVENAIRIMEEGLFVFSYEDETLAKQLQNYIVVKLQDTTNKPVYGMENRGIGDHRLDAWMLALAGLTLESSIMTNRSAFDITVPTFIGMDNGGNSYMSPQDEIAGMMNGRKRAGAPGALSILKIMRGGGSLEEDRDIKEKYYATGVWESPEGRAPRATSFKEEDDSVMAPLGRAYKGSPRRRGRKNSRSWK